MHTSTYMYMYAATPSAMEWGVPVHSSMIVGAYSSLPQYHSEDPVHHLQSLEVILPLAIQVHIHVPLIKIHKHKKILTQYCNSYVEVKISYFKNMNFLSLRSYIFDKYNYYVLYL